MNNLPVRCLLLVLLAVASNAYAQSDDWQAVQSLARGTRIKVKLKHGHGPDHCLFQGATDDEFTCDVGKGGSLAYRRDDVRAIYLNPGHRDSSGPSPVFAGALLVVPTTLILVVAGPVPILAAAGGVGVLYLITKPFLHGTTIYRSPDSKAGKTEAKPQLSGPRVTDAAGAPV